MKHTRKVYNPKDARKFVEVSTSKPLTKEQRRKITKVFWGK